MQAKEEVIFTIVVVILVLVFLAIFFMVFLVRNNARKNRLLFENERIRKEFEKTLLHTQLEIQEQTLSHVSREIHDNIGQTLSLVRLQLNMQDIPGQNVQKTGKMHEADELLGKVIQDLRLLSHSMNTNMVADKGFVASVEALLQQLQRTGRYQTLLDIYNEHFSIDDDRGIILFRMVQEILNNIVKHAHAKNIRISMKQDDDASSVVIQDDGKGFDPQMKTGSGKGMGLASIMERAGVIGGSLEIDSHAGEGTIMTITF